MLSCKDINFLQYSKRKQKIILHLLVGFTLNFQISKYEFYKKYYNFALAGAYRSVINEDRDMKLGVWYRLYLLKNE